MFAAVLSADDGALAPCAKSVRLSLQLSSERSRALDRDFTAIPFSSRPARDLRHLAYVFNRDR